MNSVMKAKQPLVRELLDILKVAIDRFNEEDTFLLVNGHSEQCLCGRLAYHLQLALLKCPEFSDYIVDIEYNRGMHGSDKAVKHIGTGACRLDIAAHKREKVPSQGGYDNLICIEMKKRSISEDRKQEDRNRLKRLTNDKGRFGFKLGAFIVADKEKLSIENLYSYYAGYEKTCGEGAQNDGNWLGERDPEIKVW